MHSRRLCDPHSRDANGTSRVKPKTPESGVLRACLDLLAAEKIWHMRMNVGAVKNGHRFVRFGRPGTADILAAPSTPVSCCCGLDCIGPLPEFLWVETKSDSGEQSQSQQEFQRDVERFGH